MTNKSEWHNVGRRDRLTTSESQTEETPMTTTNSKRINLTVTRYEGDVPFPEADHYDEYVAEQLAERYGATVEVSYGLRTNVSLYGFAGDDQRESDVEHAISTLAKVDLWYDFCSDGYKAYTNTVSSLK